MKHHIVDENARIIATSHDMNKLQGMCKDINESAIRGRCSVVNEEELETMKENLEPRDFAVEVHLRGVLVDTYTVSSRNIDEAFSKAVMKKDIYDADYLGISEFPYVKSGYAFKGTDPYHFLVVDGEIA